MKKIVLLLLVVLVLVGLVKKEIEMTTPQKATTTQVTSPAQQNQAAAASNAAPSGKRYTQTDTIIGATFAVGSLSLFGGLAAFWIKRELVAEKTLAYANMLAKMPGEKTATNQALIKELERHLVAIQEVYNETMLLAIKPYYTEKLFKRHREILQEKQAQHVINYTKNVEVLETTNYQQLTPESFAIDFVFSCLDYHVESQSGDLVSGSRKHHKVVAQTWYFDYEETTDSWLADYVRLNH